MRSSPLAPPPVPSRKGCATTCSLEAETMMPSRVTLYEVGPRDGLQNESAELPVEAKLRLVAALADAGLSRIEIGSFVRAEWIPQLADTDAVARRIAHKPGVRYAALVPHGF